MEYSKETNDMYDRVYANIRELYRYGWGEFQPSWENQKVKEFGKLLATLDELRCLLLNAYCNISEENFKILLEAANKLCEKAIAFDPEILSPYFKKD